MNIENEYPLISCLCITESRLEFLKHSVDCFLNQTYPNRELVIAYPSTDMATHQFIQAIHNPTIISLPFENAHDISLGQKRNQAIEKSNGKYFCIWDDDDWHHPQRLERQWEALTRSEAKCCVLSRIMLYDGVTGKSHLSGIRRAWEATLFCEKEITKLPEFRYPDLQKGEDSVLVFTLLEHHMTVAIDSPELYIYTHHGNNTWARSHWEKNIIGWGKIYSDNDSLRVEQVVKKQISYTESARVVEEIVSANKC